MIGRKHRFPVVDSTAAREASPRAGSRLTITTFAPMRASASEISFPMPAFAPVTMTTLSRMAPDELL